MMSRGGFGINFFSPFRFLWNIAVLALIIWFVYWLFTKSGWRITRQAGKDQEVSSAKTEG
jgi:F0F1-type ATP synthase membrane subunit b/b'